jgi:AraC family transcriptional regulator, regulatory protein of adaptative response / methylated-DNA-[protein]-cysteine methyltransferase
MNTSQAASLDSDDYERIASAIAFMRQNLLSQPDLKTVALQVNLSEYHFQRMFTKWAGISPKRFLQYLTVEYAKSRISQTKNLLDLTLDVGLSSPGRLHDLFVKLEAMSPGEFKAAGAGLQITYGIHQTSFGKCLIATTTRGICNLYFLKSTDEREAEKVLHLEWQKADIIRDEQATDRINNRIFNPAAFNREKPLVLWVKGTNFQIQVWRALLQVPFGGMTTYQNLAESIGCPTSARAVGNAVGNNPISYLIPCHRVIRNSGELGGYRWGIQRKSAMLGWEATMVEKVQ